MIYVTHGWPSTRAEVKEELQLYWQFINDLPVIYRIKMKGIRIIITVSHTKTSTEAAAC